MQLKLCFVVVSLTWSLVLPLSVIYVSVKLTCINHDIGRENVYAVNLPASYWQCTLSCQKDEKCLGMDLCQFANGSSECRLRNTSDIPECLDEGDDEMTCQHIAVVSITRTCNVPCSKYPITKLSRVNTRIELYKIYSF
jgi:hypothetical protein